MKKVFAVTCCFIINILVFSCTFLFFTMVKYFLYAENPVITFSDLLSLGLPALYFYLPLICAISSAGIFSYCIKKGSLQFYHLLLVLFFLIIIIVFVQPFLYMQKEELEKAYGFSSFQIIGAEETVLPSKILHSIKYDSEKLLNDFNSVYYENYFDYLIFAFSFFFFVFSLWGLSVTPKWKIANVLIIFLMIRAALFFYAYAVLENNYFYYMFETRKQIQALTYFIFAGAGFIFFTEGLILRKIKTLPIRNNI